MKYDDDGMPTPPIMLPVEVFLSDDFRATCMGWEADAPYRMAYSFHITSCGSVEADLEEVFAICNSHPNEMHCAEAYESVVSNYRIAGNRSLSVGDLVRIGEATWACKSAGWELAVGFTG